MRRAGPLRLLLWGDATADEFREFHCECAATCESLHAATIAEARDAVARGTFDVVMRFATRPISDHAAAEDLAASAGGALCVQALGVWCEGEGRTGRVANGWLRLFWHELPRWWRSQLRGGAADDSAARPRARLRGAVAIDCPDAELAAALVEALAEEGLTGVWAPRGCVAEPIAAGVWVGSQLGGHEAQRLDGFCKRMRGAGAPVVALLDFPRVETATAARSIGADDVFGMPLEREQLVASLVRLARSARGRRHTTPPIAAPRQASRKGNAAA